MDIYCHRHRAPKQTTRRCTRNRQGVEETRRRRSSSRHGIRSWWSETSTRQVARSCAFLVFCVRRAYLNTQAMGEEVEEKTWCGLSLHGDGLYPHCVVPLHSRKYHLRLVFHFMELAAVTAWLLYRCSCDRFLVPKKKNQHSLLEFKASVAEALCKSRSTRRSRSSGSVEADLEQNKKVEHASKPIPQEGAWKV